eukprot:CAMPEP_0178373016 /NCGR_PEP_ID=MMETSP0689_2-20121128/1649_1 /TAXON_ID=160604 /ORGANISM="Amphidinium massartii, Strain CS-259" /LENGTH=619 /DNA_ID=CAMNT_0019992953 /DNA_START=21 /DNA_END=1876 /DNA_ORIENTATION=+
MRTIPRTSLVTASILCVPDHLLLAHGEEQCRRDAGRDDCAAGEKQVLDCGDIHVVDNFLNATELHHFRGILDRAPGDVDVASSAWSEVQPSSTDRQLVWAIARRVSDYVNAQLRSNTVMTGPWRYKGQYHVDTVQLRRYQSLSYMSAHIDTGNYARCLSAVVHVGDKPCSGGRFQSFRRKHPSKPCGTWHGWRSDPAKAEPPPEALTASGLRQVEEADYAPGRLVVLLAETPHAVTRLEPGDERDVLFIWFSCEPTLVNGAATNGHVELVDELLSARADVDQVDRYQRTALADAAYSGHQAIVQLLVHKKASLEKRDVEGWGPLHWATVKSHWQVVDSLAALGAHTSLLSELGYQAQQGSEHKVERLLQTLAATHSPGLSVNAADEFGRHPLFMAAAGGHLHIVRLLLHQRASVNHRVLETGDDSSGMYAIHAAADGGHLPVVKALLKAKAKLDSETAAGLQPLHAAALQGHSAVVRLLVKQGADPNQMFQGHGLVHEAAANGDVAMLRVLLSVNANVELQLQDSSTPLGIAAMQGHVEAVKLLLEAQMQSPQKLPGSTAMQQGLQWAAQSGHVEVVQMFLQYVPAAVRGLPFDWAAHGGHIAVLQLFLAAVESQDEAA